MALQEPCDGAEVIAQHAHPCLERITQQGYRLLYRFEESPIEIEGMRDLTIFTAQGGETVATADLTDDEMARAFYVQNVSVQPAHRRRGLANAIYVFAEKLVGKTLYNFWTGDNHQSPEARALWAQPNRPFGPQPRKVSG